MIMMLMAGLLGGRYEAYEAYDCKWPLALGMGGCCVTWLSLAT